MANPEGIEEKRTKCTVYSRVVGYLSPTTQWNKGKREEFKNRVTYDEVLENAE